MVAMQCGGYMSVLSSEASGQSRRALLTFQAGFHGVRFDSQGKPALIFRRFILSQRGNGKSLVVRPTDCAQSITPGDPAARGSHVENILVSSSRDQAKIVLEFVRQSLGNAAGFRWSDTGCHP